MTQTIWASFDGNVIVPNEPLDLAAGTLLTVTLAPCYAPDTTPEEQKAAWESLLARVHSQPVPHIPDEALRRENMYED